MIKIENVSICGLEEAIRGMRNPMNSWGNSDSFICENDYSSRCFWCENNYEGRCEGRCYETFVMGNADYELMMKLATGGPVHAKYRRMIIVYLDITAPLYWWKEFDTYKVGTVANSCSTMHKIQSKKFVMADFSHEHLIGEINNGSIKKDTPLDCLRNTIAILNNFRDRYLENPTKTIWWQMIQLLPSSYNQKRTIMLNYEVLTGIYRWRKDHKLDEWREFCKWIETLPHSGIITNKVKRGVQDGIDEEI